jgi:lysozyme family protein
MAWDKSRGKRIARIAGNVLILMCLFRSTMERAMRENIGKGLEFVLQFEGGYSDHPSDPGGATMKGITKAVLEQWRGRSVTKAEVRALGDDEIQAIYKARYWDEVRGDLLPAGIDVAVFDCAVNQGPARAARLLQMAARVTADGQIGPQTLAAVKAADPVELLNEFMARRMNAYGLLQTLFRTFGLGWSRRLLACHSAALKLI